MKKNIVFSALILLATVTLFMLKITKNACTYRRFICWAGITCCFYASYTEELENSSVGDYLSYFLLGCIGNGHSTHECTWHISIVHRT